MDTFRFVLRRDPRALTNDDMLAALRQCAALPLPVPLATRDFNKWPQRPCRAQDIAARFGSWAIALNTAGLPSRLPPDPAELIDTLEAVWRRLGRPPGAIALQTLSRFADHPYRARWGSLRGACEALASFHAGAISREQLLAGAPRKTPARRMPRDLRWAILKRDNYRCLACGQSPATDPAVTLEVDHITPVSRGGTNDQANLRTLCRACNAGKSDSL